MSSPGPRGTGGRSYTVGWGGSGYKKAPGDMGHRGTLETTKVDLLDLEYRESRDGLVSGERELYSRLCGECNQSII